MYDNSPYCTQDRGSGNGPDDISQDADQSGEFYWYTPGSGSFGTVGADNGSGAGGSSPLTWLLGDVGVDGGAFSSTDAAPCIADTCVTVNATVDPLGFILSSFHPSTPVWGPNHLAHAGCTGSGIPCYLTQYLKVFSPEEPGVSSYQYTIWDVNNNVVANVTSVNEYFLDGTGTLPLSGQSWISNGLFSLFPYGNLANGQFIDNVAGAYTATQAFSAWVGGVNYVIRTTASMFFGSSTPINDSRP